MSEDKHKPNPIDVFEAFYSSIHKYVDARIEQAKKNEESTLIQRLVDKINTVLKQMPPKPDVERQLLGRTIELNQNASDALASLQAIKLDLEKDVDKELLPFIDAVMKPMIRDVVRIQNSLYDDQAIYKQAEVFKRFSEWVDRAKMWVELCSVKKDKETIVAAVIQHTLDDFSNRIERDKRLIEDYMDHVLAYLSFEDDQKELLSKEIRRVLVPYVKNLTNLKRAPKKLALEDLNKWKERADIRRDRYYNIALQIIDNLVSQVSPSVAGAYQRANLIGLLEQLEFLETEVTELCNTISKRDEIMDVEASLIEMELLSFEQEVQDLYFDVRLPADAVDRLLLLKELLATTFNQFKDQKR